jgi:hypothetical protein
MEGFFRAIETTGLSTWIRESSSLLAFPGILIAHTLGMAMLVGVAVTTSLRVMGVAPGVPLLALNRFMPLAWAGLIMMIASGLLLLVAYPMKALTNPIFYVKLVVIGFAVFATVRVGRAGATKRLAAVVILLWAATITAGRLLPYTYHHLLSGS